MCAYPSTSDKCALITALVINVLSSMNVLFFYFCLCFVHNLLQFILALHQKLLDSAKGTATGLHEFFLFLILHEVQIFLCFIFYFLKCFYVYYFLGESFFCYFFFKFFQ